MTNKTKQEWSENCLASVLKRSPERQDNFKTTSDIELDTVYTPEDLTDSDYLEDLGYPAEYPFTRGVQPNMYRGRIWTMRQYAGFGSAEETNNRYRYLLEEGQTGLSVAFDLPTQIGYDSDHPLARGEVGKVGVAVDSLHDMEIIFNGIPLDKISTSMTVNATCAPILAMYIAVAKKQGVALDRLDGTTQNDILKEYIARGTYIFPPKPSIRLIADTAAYCSKYLPRWNYINIAGYHIREAGSTAAQEIGFTLADAIEYVKAIVDTGLDIDSFAPRISFIFQTHNNFFEEIAKLRALRRLWAKLMKERFGANNPRSWTFRTHIQTGGVTLTSQQPMNNIVRATVQALAAALGGIQSLAISCYDEGHCIPTEESVRQSLRLQQILAHESGITDVVDPLGGSYYMEFLTNELERMATEYIAKIDSLGGAAVAIEQGYQQREIQEASYRYQKEIESSERVVVGINKFISTSPKITLSKVGSEVELSQKNKLAKFKRDRDNAKANQTLKRLEDAARDNENTMPAFLECVEAYATLGEMCDVLRNVFSIQREFLVV
ncbi:MAG: methylmalonyl-CoA mutase family protein [Chloroflexota bacterium]|nr:methylmalonyl-CoA mutase family protein [Chloroflexota bacterium]